MYSHEVLVDNFSRIYLSKTKKILYEWENEVDNLYLITVLKRPNCMREGRGVFLIITSDYKCEQSKSNYIIWRFTRIFYIEVPPLYGLNIADTA